MSEVRSALIVGGGVGGMSAALVLRRLRIEVELIDLDPLWRVYGAGITLTGPTLRAFDRLGVYDEVAAQGYTGDGIRVCDVAGRTQQEILTPRPVDSRVAGSGGILRPILHGILAARTRASGATVRLGVSVESLTPRDDGVEAVFTDGERRHFDLVIGADGLFSKARQLIFPQAPVPAYLGQTIWRLIVPRPAAIDRRHYFLGGPVKVGLTPVSAAEMYMFLLQNTPEPIRLPDDALAPALGELLAGYGGELASIRAGLSAQSRIVMRPLQGFLLAAPWHVPGVLLIGDAAHPTTPQLASGAGMAAEDALVLGEELARNETSAAAFAGYMQRRYERCRMVVENSLEIGRRERAGEPAHVQTQLVAASLNALAMPY
jgi:2-polyprenyl-6-methoxyphenol hydroxylase-like FAD-dependent oxidoreductase